MSKDEFNLVEKGKLYDNLSDEELKCDVCGMSYLEFLQTGVFRCDNCRIVFKYRFLKTAKDKIMKEKEFEKMVEQSASSSDGKITKNNKAKIKSKINELKELLELSKKLKDKEKVATITAEIQRLEALEVEK